MYWQQKVGVRIHDEKLTDPDSGAKKKVGSGRNRKLGISTKFDLGRPRWNFYLGITWDLFITQRVDFTGEVTLKKNYNIVETENM
jgi:hypothetical protein